MEHSIMQKRNHGFLFTILSFLFFSGIISATEPEIDLNRFDAYIRNGFAEEYFTKPVDYKNDKNWLSMPARKNRLIRVTDLKLEGTGEHSFLSSHQLKDHHYTIVIPFVTDTLQKSKILNPGLILAGIGENYEIFLNGKSIRREIHLDDSGQIKKPKSVRSLVLPLDKDWLREGENILGIHILGDPGYNNTGLYIADPYKIAPLESLYKSTNESFGLVLITLYLFVGLYHILLFIRRPKEHYNLYFGLFGVLLFLYLLCRTNTVFALIDNSRYIMVLELSVLFMLAPILLFFMESLLLGKIFIAEKIYFGIMVFFSILIPLTPETMNHDLLRIWQMTGFVVVFYILGRVIWEFAKEVRNFYRGKKKSFPGATVDLSTEGDEQGRKPNPISRAIGSFFSALLYSHSGNLSLGFFVLSFTTIFDVVDTFLWNTGASLTRYGFFVFVMGIAISLANSFLTVHKAVEDLNTHLDNKVKERTSELNETLKKVSALKVQQDGDYFLTSLLTEPLMRNETQSSSVKIDFYVKEKKEFKFRKWEKEIGGDFCMADAFSLREKPYLMFINADAMGKSIQGAGGVLVLGSVLNSLINRTKVLTAYNELYPERWLRNAFVELQEIFESFNGSMLVSSVLGLVDEESGLMYFINAEHPWCILYRDNKAVFIEEELTFRKLGTQGVKGKIWIQTFQLQAGDVVFIGSDGKDDILIEAGETMVMNENETLILEKIEKSQGQLVPLVEILKKTGEITDDLSILRISFKENIGGIHQKEREAALASQRMAEPVIFLYENGNYQDALKKGELLYKEKPDLDVARLLVQTALKLKDYARVFKYSREVFRKNPEDSKYIYLASLSAKVNKNFKDSIDLGERFRLRDPENINNLINLADAYRLSGNMERAEKMSNEVLRQDSTNENARKILALINKN